MSKLEHSRAMRGGASTSMMSFETKRCSYEIDRSTKAVVFSFPIASKGGGTTCIDLHVGIDDMPDILLGIAVAFPEYVEMFGKAASAAHRKNARTLNKLRKLNEDSKTLCEYVLTELEPLISSDYDTGLETTKSERNKKFISKTLTAVSQAASKHISSLIPQKRRVGVSRYCTICHAGFHSQQR